MLRAWFFLFGLFLLSCSAPKAVIVEELPPVEGQTGSGFHYVHHLRHPGPKPQAGDFARFHLQMIAGDSMLFDSRQHPNMPNVSIPPAGEMPSPASPILEALLLMSVGDSLSISFPLDFQGAPAPAGLEGADALVYTIVLNAILDAEAFQAEQRASVPAALAQEEAFLQDRLTEARLETRFRWKQYRTGLLDPFLLEMPSGIRYFPLEIGAGDPPAEGDWVRYHLLRIAMADGMELENSYSPRKNLMTRIGEDQLSPALSEALTRLPAFSTLILFLPDPEEVIYLQTLPLHQGQ